MFDVDKTRGQLLSGIGIERYLSRDFERAREKRALTSTSSSIIGCAIECLLVGFDEPAYKLLEKAREWLVAAIAGKELRRGFTLEWAEPARLEHLGLCEWLLTGKHAAELLSDAVKGHDRYWQIHGPDKLSVDLALVTYLDAGACDQAIELFERTRGLSPPKSLSQVRTEGRMAYVLCRHRRDRSCSEEEIRVCLRRFLSGQVKQWLNDGLYSVLVRWMKIAHWNGVESAQSAREALLHCYDYLPCPSPFGSNDIAGQTP